MRELLGRIPLVGAASVAAVRLARDPHVELAVWRDYFATWRATAFLRQIAPPPGAPTLLVLSLGHDVYELKLIGMLAAGLRRSGWRVVALTSHRLNTRAQWYFSSFGVDDFVYLSDFKLTRDERRACFHLAAELMRGELTFSGVKAWSYDGSWIGPQVLSTVSRGTLSGAPDLSDPMVRASLAAILPGTLQRVAQAKKLIASVRPDLGLTIESNYATYGPLVDMAIASGVDVIQVLQPWRDDALTFKRLNPDTRRMHAGSISPTTFDRLRYLSWTAEEEARLGTIFAGRYGGKWLLQNRNQLAARRMERDEIVTRLQLDPGKRTAVVFSHLLWDANLFYGEDLFEDYGEWFIETIRAAVTNAGVNWLVKLHPANVWKRAREGVTGELSEVVLIRRAIGDLPGHIKLLYPDTDISTLSLFELADFGVTVRGTAGMELPCFGVTTFTAGTGRYSGLGFTVDSASRHEYLQRLQRLPDAPIMTEEQIRLAKRHALAAFQQRQWTMRSFRSVFHPDFGRGGTLDQNLEVQVASLAELDRNGDLNSWAMWAGGSREIDYLELQHDT